MSLSKLSLKPYGRLLVYSAMNSAVLVVWIVRLKRLVDGGRPLDVCVFFVLFLFPYRGGDPVWKSLTTDTSKRLDGGSDETPD